MLSCRSNTFICLPTQRLEAEGAFLIYHQGPFFFLLVVILQEKEIFKSFTAAVYEVTYCN